MNASNHRLFSHWFTLCALCALLLSYSLYHLWLTEHSNLLLWLVKTLPLLCFLPGVWRGHKRSLQWLAFLSLLYFIDGILIVFSLSGTRSTEIAGLCITLLTVMLYSSVIIYVRRIKPAASIREKGHV